jgi:RNA polymerase sigma-70 factor (ECF subfamily)
VDNRAERFRDLIEPLLDDAYTLARYLSRDSAVAEDIVQDAALRAFRHLGTLRGGSETRAWLLKIVRNCFYSWREKVGRANLEPLDADSWVDDSSSDLDPQRILEQTLNQDAVRELIEELPVQFRETLVLREMNELSYKEIAELTSQPIGTVMSRLARARGMLKKRWLERAL